MYYYDVHVYIYILCDAVNYMLFRPACSPLICLQILKSTAKSQLMWQLAEVELATTNEVILFGPLLNRVFAPDSGEPPFNSIDSMDQCIKQANNTSSNSINSASFHIGIQFLFWKVISKSTQEMLLRWEWKGISGYYTLLGYDSTHNILYHGNLLIRHFTSQ